jgi:hypothetical protein
LSGHYCKPFPRHFAKLNSGGTAGLEKAETQIQHELLGSLAFDDQRDFAGSTGEEVDGFFSRPNRNLRGTPANGSNCQQGRAEGDR